MRSSAASWSSLLVSLLWCTLLTAPCRAQLHALETENLRLVYMSPTLDFIAPYTAKCFENSLRFHRKLWGYNPTEKANIILQDFSDYGNAGVWVNPRNSMVVDIAPLNFVYETGPANERINHTMNHEVVHIIALDKPSGRDRFFRGVFHGKVRDTAEHPETILYGFLTTPRRSSPRWYHEGIAVFLETWMAGGLGRAQSPYDEMVFRSKVRDSTHIYDPLGLESEGTKVDFQVGVNSYLYGTRFLSYLAYEYSPESLIQWVGRGSGSKAYYSSQFRKVYGRPLDDEWKRWIEWEQGVQRKNLDTIRTFPTTPYRDLSTRALGSVSRAYYDKDTREIYTAVLYPGTVAHLAAIPVDGGAPRNLGEVKGPALYFVTSLAYDTVDKLLYYTADNNSWRDLCVLNPATGKSKVLIKDARLGDLAINPKDRSMWGVRHFNGYSTLVRLPYPYKDWNRVVSWPFGRDMYDLDISPDGSRIAASFAEVNGRQTLRLLGTDALMARDTTSVTLFDFGSSIPTSFAFSSDGRYLYGSSYYTGVSNIFRWNFDGDSMEVVSNSETGFFRPLPVSPDSLIVFRYSGEGFTPALIEPKPLSDVSAITFLGQTLAEKHPVLTSWKVPPPSSVELDSMITYSGPYRGFRGIRPSTLYPIVLGYKDHVAAGMRMEFSDPIQLNTFHVSAAYSPATSLPEKERWHLRAGYERHDLRATVQYNPASFYDLFGPTKTGLKGYGAGISTSRNLLYDAPRSIELEASIAGYGGLERLPDAQNISTSPGFDKLISGELGIHEENLRSSIGSVDKEKGYQWSLALPWDFVRFERPPEAAWTMFPKGVATFDAGTSLLLRNASVWLRTAAGYGHGDPDEPFANFYFGGFGNNYVDRKEVKRYRDYNRFPGFELDELGGTEFAKVLVEWNLPPVRFRRVGTPTFYASWLRASTFVGSLVTNPLEREAYERREAWDVGIQADLQLHLLTQYKLTLSGGYARGFEGSARSKDEWMVSLKVL